MLALNFGSHQNPIGAFCIAHPQDPVTLLLGAQGGRPQFPETPAPEIPHQGAETSGTRWTGAAVGFTLSTDSMKRAVPGQLEHYIPASRRPSPPTGVFNQLESIPYSG